MPEGEPDCFHVPAPSSRDGQKFEGGTSIKDLDLHTV